MAFSCGAVLMMLSAVALFAYTTFQENLGTLAAPNTVVTRWASLPVGWLLNSATPSNNVSTSGCSSDAATCIQQSLAAGFTTWMSAQIQGQSLTDVNVLYVGPVSITDPNVSDCKNVLGFSDTTSGDFPTGTIAFTQVGTVTQPTGTTGSFQYSCSGSANKTCDLPSCIVDADIEFNPNENFATSNSPPSGTFSLQSVATHEEGHLLGMDHSGIGHTMMFPFGDTVASGQPISLAADDAIGISFLYPSSNFDAATGKISGTVSLNGIGAFGAHVLAIDNSTGNVVMDGLTAPDGTYTLVGMPPGSYHILVLPLAPDESSGIVILGDFSGWGCGYGDSQCGSLPQNPTNYTGRYY